MSERGFELQSTPEAWTRVIESNVEVLERRLKGQTWKRKAGSPIFSADVLFYATDTGFVCNPGDPHMAYLCSAEFVYMNESVTCPYLDIKPQKDFSDVPPQKKPAAA
jgi:hypothetical protein